MERVGLSLDIANTAICWFVQVINYFCGKYKGSSIPGFYVSQSRYIDRNFDACEVCMSHYIADVKIHVSYKKSSNVFV